MAMKKGPRDINSKSMPIPSKPSANQIMIEGCKIMGGNREKKIPSSPEVIKGGK